jgi:endonuclease-3
MTPQAIRQVFETFEKLNPSPRGELDYTNPYTLLVAVVLSAQATDKGVNRATGPLFKKVSTPQEMLALGQDGLEAAIKSIGLYRTKAKHIIALSQRLIAVYDARVPNDQKALESLPGVGRKTANVVRNIAFGEATIAVDTHIFRVSNRTGLAPGKTPRAVENMLEKVVPARFKHHAHHWLILHGRYVCTARAPKCGLCPIARWCSWPDKMV